MDLTGRTLVVAYGAGVDSTAILVGFVRWGIVPFEMLFVDVGAEKPSTYAYVPVMSDYLVSHGFPDDAQYTYWYPLQERGWDRDRCKREIAR